MWYDWFLWEEMSFGDPVALGVLFGMFGMVIVAAIWAMIVQKRGRRKQPPGAS